MRKSCIILGAGRSGTSLVAGLFRHSGHYLGSDLVSPTVSNPTGYFEDHEINRINEDLLARLQKDLPAHRLATRLPATLQRRIPIYATRPKRSQRWLSVPPRLATAGDRDGRLTERMVKQASRTPFCFKDPRFANTLPAWRDLVPESLVHICVFRHPWETVVSMQEDCRSQPYLHNLRLTDAMALKVWTNAYKNCLQMSERGTWIFVHYEDVLSGKVVNDIETAVGADLDRTLARAELHRSVGEGDLPQEAASVYLELLSRAR